MDAHDCTYANIHAHVHPHMAPGLNESAMVYVDTLAVERRGTTSFIGVHNVFYACLTRSLSLVHDTASRHALLHATHHACPRVTGDPASEHVRAMQAGVL
jgi:hypothetical protein